ncbi:Xaa-Pro peptidase family protein [Mucilaginibacter sabulilitoris]|uniref:Xaa-Pro peptidase family protein n=1 Tax=Mucilaginibacter sabulilitoris TaxID=1173583 RepID=A0ABZ0THB9_9SPHI|nr:Xaa-Pro peptidase family protein [Mucilaginibacter sabulilitoris]WPU92206.1 Xaa-Pro peptidase family protein [Mucilaginibacter sabulilitoris]
MNVQKRLMFQQIIKQHSLGALVFWRPDELVLALGYMPQWGLSFLVYTRDDAPVLFVPELEPDDILPGNIEIRKFPWGNINCADPWKDLFSQLKDLIGKRGLNKYPVSFIKNIGGTAPCRMSGEQPHLPYDLIEQLLGLSDSGFNDVTNDLLKLYLYKNEEDVRCLKLVHEVAAMAIQTFYNNLKVGNSEAIIASAIEMEVQTMTGKNGAHFAKAWPLIQSGVNAAFGGRFNRTTGRILEESEMIMLEMSVCVNGYWADITHTGQTSVVSDHQKKIFNTVFEAQQLAISMMKPGVKMGEVDAAARTYIDKAGFGHLYNHALGHHVGFRYHDPGPTLSPGSVGVLEEGMLLTVEPGIYGMEINGGVRIEDNVLITADGCLVLSDYPKWLSI